MSFIDFDWPAESPNLMILTVSFDYYRYPNPMKQLRSRINLSNGSIRFPQFDALPCKDCK